MIEVPDRLLDAVYDAATDQQLWRSVLTQIADLTGSQGGVLFGQSFGAASLAPDRNSPNSPGSPTGATTRSWTWSGRLSNCVNMQQPRCGLAQPR
jgi:hypothetical protein